MKQMFRRPISFRGLDDCGEWTDNINISLFHTRLSIIDLAEGCQPMADIDDVATIVFNGEIYNYVELRKEYEQLGARFRTQSDTEVILEGYKLKGKRVVRDLIGMFAFAIWDKRKKCLLLARDRLGKKPLYYYSANGSFYFSSSVSSFHALPSWTGALSQISLAFYGAVGSFPLNQTAFQKVSDLPPGHTATVRPGREPLLDCYWRLNFSEKRRVSKSAALLEYEHLLAEAVRIRLRADVPIGLTFSGGVDSGTIAAVAIKCFNTKLKCFSIDYHTERSPSEEIQIGHKVSGLLGLPLFVSQFDYHNEMLPTLDGALTYADQPCNNPAISYSKTLYETIRPHAKVVLSGNGADELFLGYDGNQSLWSADIKQKGWTLRLLRFVCGQTNNNSSPRWFGNYQCDYLRAQLATHRDSEEVDDVLRQVTDDIIECGVRSHADLYTYMALTYYTRDANFRIPDIAGLAAQVEVRSPFLDHRMVEFAAKLPTNLKIGNPDNSSKNKLIPKLYYQKFVSHDVAWAQKKGMGWNIKYGESFADDPKFRHAFEDALSRVASVGLDDARLRSAWNQFAQQKRQGVRYPTSGGVVLSGFMLGRWLKVAGYGS